MPRRKETMAEASKSNPAPAASAPSFDEWRSRLDAGARQAGIGAAQQPAAGFPVGGMPGMGGMPNMPKMQNVQKMPNINLDNFKMSKFMEEQMDHHKKHHLDENGDCKPHLKKEGFKYYKKYMG